MLPSPNAKSAILENQGGKNKRRKSTKQRGELQPTTRGDRKKEEGGTTGQAIVTGGKTRKEDGGQERIYLLMQTCKNRSAAPH